jgi:hypothetical protein
MDEVDQFSAPNDETHIVDIDAVGDAIASLWPKGWMNFTITEHDYELSQNSGSPMWTLKLEVDADPNPITGEVNPLAGKTIKTWMSFSKDAIPFTKKTANSLIPGIFEDPAFRVNGKFDIKACGEAQPFVGLKVKGLIKHSKYNGEMRNQVGNLTLNTAGGQNAFMQA